MSQKKSSTPQFQQATDLKEEGAALKEVLDRLTEEDWARPTPFKDWTVNQVIVHLHGSDKMAVLALKDPAGFAAAKADPETIRRMMNPRAGDSPDSPPLAGRELLHIWWAYFTEMCELLGDSAPQARIPWFGPDMGAMMFTTARQMETWAHGQDIFDLFGTQRVNTARLKNIVVIGVKTYGWTFANRGMEVPGPAPYIRLTGQGGEIWEFNEVSEDNRIEGAASDFCHVVTQGRNIADVSLNVVGAPATQWMAIAQCFAGPPEDPPAPGSRLVNFQGSAQ